jgi:secreted Zn-dependent insulinase-like peptidase
VTAVVSVLPAVRRDFVLFSVFVVVVRIPLILIAACCLQYADSYPLCYYHAGMLQRSGPQEWVWQEMKETADMNFRFINKVEPASYATGLANGMHIYSIPHTVCGAHLQFECDLQEVWSYLTHFTPSNSIVLVAHKGLAGKTTLKERWYGTDYNKVDYTAQQLQRWETRHADAGEWANMLHLPMPNPFIPTDFDLKPGSDAVAEAAHPKLVQRVVDAAAPLDVLAEQDRPADATAASAEAAQEGSGAATEGEAETQGHEGEGEEEHEGEEGEEEDPAAAEAELPVLAGQKLLTWHLQDTTWKVPKANVKVSLETLQATSTPLGVVLTELFAMCLKENLNEYSYYADCAGNCTVTAIPVWYTQTDAVCRLS